MKGGRKPAWMASLLAPAPGRTGPRDEEVAATERPKGAFLLPRRVVSALRLPSKRGDQLKAQLARRRENASAWLFEICELKNAQCCGRKAHACHCGTPVRPAGSNANTPEDGRKADFCNLELTTARNYYFLRGWTVAYGGNTLWRMINLASHYRLKSQKIKAEAIKKLAGDRQVRIMGKVEGNKFKVDFIACNAAFAACNAPFTACNAPFVKKDK